MREMKREEPKKKRAREAEFAAWTSAIDRRASQRYFRFRLIVE
jgi:hypothetical protein